jgi:hypothetical protein
MVWFDAPAGGLGPEGLGGGAAPGIPKITVRFPPGAGAEGVPKGKVLVTTGAAGAGGCAIAPAGVPKITVWLDLAGAEAAVAGGADRGCTAGVPNTMVWDTGAG